jgi:Ca2+/H+ antiporter, TMEM165/GDT1 family
MVVGWTHAAPSIMAAFLASFVEFVEALTIILAVGSVRGWRSALGGSGCALVLMLALVAALGPALAQIPLDVVQTIVGVLLLLFGLRWLRKAILRAVGVIPLHDESAAFARETARLRRLGGRSRWDTEALATSFQITMLEGMEVIFIVTAIGAGGPGLLLPASIGALAALLAVIALGLTVHRPLAKVPENTVKFIVGVLLSGFGTFWIGEGLGISWLGGDWAIPTLSLAFLTIALLIMQFGRAHLARPEVL